MITIPSQIINKAVFEPKEIRSWTVRFFTFGHLSYGFYSKWNRNWTNTRYSRLKKTRSHKQLEAKTVQNLNQRIQREGCCGKIGISVGLICSHYKNRPRSWTWRFSTFGHLSLCSVGFLIEIKLKFNWNNQSWNKYETKSPEVLGALSLRFVPKSNTWTNWLSIITFSSNYETDELPKF